MYLELTSKSDPFIKPFMDSHYSAPRGFVGRSLIYRIIHDGVLYGFTVAGSATKFLPGRDTFFGERIHLNNIVNNTFYHVERYSGKYPIRNFTTKVIEMFRQQAINDWEEKYGEAVLGWETLVEMPRTGSLYLKDGWIKVGETKGFTCKRVAGRGTDNWSGKRVWDTVNLRPKNVLCRSL